MQQDLLLRLTKDIIKSFKDIVKKLYIQDKKKLFITCGVQRGVLSATVASTIGTGRLFSGSQDV